jgi:hypothetical protein
MPDRLLRPGLRHNLVCMKRIAISRPPLPALPLEGGCHCGAVRYAVTARPMAVNACHCDDSKRLSGGPFALYLHVAKGALETLGEPRGRFIRTGGSGNAIPIERWALRGKRICHLPEAAPDLVILCAATQDESRWAIPASHISTEYAAAEAVAAEGALVAESFQTTRRALWARFSEIYPAGTEGDPA